MFSNLSRRERIMLIFLVVFAILAAYYYALYEPMVENLDSLRQEISDKEMQINRNLAIIAKMPKLEERYDKISYIEDEILKNRIDSVPAILQILEDEAEISGLEIISFSPQEQDEDTRITMEARGYYNQVVNFLDGIKRLDGQIIFNRLSVNKANSEDDLLRINGVYIYKNDLIGGGDS
ncbi:MAG: type 4a pilus biogenesis protein PilO [Halanaerobiales bacterium]